MMTSIRLSLTGPTARAEVEGVLTAGMVGVPVHIVCDSAWDGLHKSLVCQGGVSGRTILNVGDEAVVAPEALLWGKWSRNELFLGLEGRRADGTLVIPSTMAYCGQILPGSGQPEELFQGQADHIHQQITSSEYWSSIYLTDGDEVTYG